MKRHREHTIIGKRLAELGRAMARVPSGKVFNSHTIEGRVWDANTGLFLRPKAQSNGQGKVKNPLPRAEESE